MLRPARPGDRDRILLWRNHPEVRAVSLTRHVISPEEHAAWWDRIGGDASRQLLLYVRGEQAAGVVTFTDLDPVDRPVRTASWGYYLDNAGLTARGELLPAWIQLQREAVRYADDVLGLSELHGEVLATNEAVRRLNRRNGFHEVDAELRDLDGESVEIIRVVRRRPADRARQEWPRQEWTRQEGVTTGTSNEGADQ